MVKGYWLAVKEAFLPIEPSKYYFHRGGAKVSPRWKKDATAVEGRRHRGDGNLCSYAPEKMHYENIWIASCFKFYMEYSIPHAEFSFSSRRGAEFAEHTSLLLVCAIRMA